MTEATLRQPRGMVLLNGSPAPFGFIEFDIDNNSNYQADTFSMTLPLCGNDKSLMFDQLNYWSSTLPLEVEVLVGFPSNVSSFTKADLTSFFVGFVDEIDVGIFENKVALHGRDLTAAFLDSKSSDKFQNQTSSQIITALALRHGVPAVVNPTSTIAGVYYQQDHVELSADRPEWDLMTYLAQKEGYNLFASQGTLYFLPRDDTTSTYAISAKHDGTKWVSTAEELNLQRTLTIARDIKVIVRSWNSLQKAAFVKTSTISKQKLSNKPESGGYSAVQTYTYNIRDLTAEQAQKRANELAAVISQHEVELTATLPGDITLSTRDIISLAGTATQFDQTYYPDSVSRSFSARNGFTMRVHAKNHNPESTVVP